MYALVRPQIVARLGEFATVPRSQWFYEFCYCICTPQSRATHAGTVVARLEEQDFLHTGADPTSILASRDSYIRFHNTKAHRLLALRKQWPVLEQKIDKNADARSVRSFLVQQVNGFGLKEASHALRNIGFTNLAILDRHILRILRECSVLDDRQKISTPTQYIQVERVAQEYALSVGIVLDEMDLLFWYAVTGEILK